MKKKITILMSVFALGFGFNANAQAVDEGNVLIDVYSGGPNLFTSVIKGAYTNAGGTYENVKIGGLPCLGLRVGYMVTDRISIGIDANYTSTVVTYSEASGSNVYDYTLSIPRIRAMARFEFHFGSSDKFDFYMPVGVGYSSIKYNYTTTDPDGGSLPSVRNLIPVAFRYGIGGRYFFTDNIGLNLELGLGGGPILEGGLAFKF